MTTPRGPFDPDAPVRLSPHVSLREESFGALAYHFGTRRLVFLKSKALVALVEALGAHDSAGAAVDALVEPRDRGRYLAALAKLHADGVLDAA